MKTRAELAHARQAAGFSAACFAFGGCLEDYNHLRRLLKAAVTRNCMKTSYEKLERVR